MPLRRLSSWLAPGRAGFAGIPGLARPRDWNVLARDAIAQCEALVDEVVRAPPSAAVVRLLDNISDTLCQVLDAAEFCRNVHADKEWREHAQQVCVDLSGYVQELNTHFGIYSALVRSLEQHDAAAGAAAAAAAGAAGRGAAALAGAVPRTAPGGGGFTPEALLVGRMLRRDFERYGVHLPGERRDRMAALVQRGHQLGMAITQNVVDPRQLGTLELRGPLAAAAQQLPLALQKKFRPLAPDGGGLPGGLLAPADTPTLHALMRGARDERLRRAAFEACQRQPGANLAALDALVEARHEVAALMGFPSYAAYQLDAFSLAGQPSAVVAFLERLTAGIAPKCAAELAEMRELKRLHLGAAAAAACGGEQRAPGAAPPQVQPWDRQFLAQAARSGEDAAQLNALPEYFELERVVEGLGELLRRSMGVSLREVPLEPGEGWAPLVRKLEATHDADGFLGTIYLDLHRRPHKFPSAAHFTLRCGRRRDDGSYQTPIVALVANMGQHSSLAVSEVEMLFHEFGHALNSLLSRTEFQHLSGTRGPLDMVEVPSHTLELFAHDPRVLALFARHRGTGEPLPPALLQALEVSRRRFVALDQQQQIQYCLIDQLLHGPDPPTGQRAADEIAQLMRTHSALGHAEGCHPHIRFTHLVGYGATYYSYLYAQCLAARIWQDHLADDPTSREAGELLRHRLLQPGGAKEARSMVEDLLSPSCHKGATSSGGAGCDSGSGSGSGSSGGGAASGSGALCQAAGGVYPDPSAMLRQQGLLA
ncbi:hypothetical protein ABPG77_009155 [Micractinium sp. CCAP 211/92]